VKNRTRLLWSAIGWTVASPFLGFGMLLAILQVGPLIIAFLTFGLGIFLYGAVEHWTRFMFDHWVGTGILFGGPIFLQRALPLWLQYWGVRKATAEAFGYSGLVMAMCISLWLLLSIFDGSSLVCQSVQTNLTNHVGGFCQ
jgi:hypothetical protein